MKKQIKIGTRGSPLAMAQTRTVCARLAEAHPDLETEIVVIQTSGDWKPADGEVRLSAVEGGKGLFAKEIEQALLDGRIDAAVHSMKDMDSTLPEGLVVEHMLVREDPRDALLFSRKIKELADYSQLKNEGLAVLPQGSIVGSASVRRGAFLLSARPDLKIVPFRGNVQTRIDKLRGPERGGVVDCTLLAMAGLNRLGLAGEADIVLEPEEMLPAAAQGAVGIEVRASDDDILSIFGYISDLNTVLCVKAEREVLRILDGSCHTPIGVYGVLDGGELWLRVRVVSLDGAQRFDDEIRGGVQTVEEGQSLGRVLGERLKRRVLPEIFNQEIVDDG
ncbi:MAG: hydroxymethylbilane synthase [Alphaproteobacteria bacterium]|nr:hydroxymethylbilane synthase [Alphaproteobacteria bacterium]